MNIFVAGLPGDLDDAKMMEIFEKFGEVNSATSRLTAVDAGLLTAEAL